MMSRFKYWAFLVILLSDNQEINGESDGNKTTENTTVPNGLTEEISEINETKTRNPKLDANSTDEFHIGEMSLHISEYTGPYHYDSVESKGIGPVGRMPFQLYDKLTKECKEKLKLPVTLGEGQNDQINALWNCTFDSWFKTIESCREWFFQYMEEYYKGFPGKNGTSDMKTTTETSPYTDFNDTKSTTHKEHNRRVAKNVSADHDESEHDGTADSDFEEDLDYKTVNGIQWVHWAFLVNHSSPFERVPKAVLNCTLKRFNYDPNSAASLQSFTLPFYVTALQFFMALEF